MRIRTETLSAVSIGDFGRLMTILEKYVSRTMVRAVMLNAVSRVQVRPEQIKREHMEQIVEEAMVGLRLFCDAERLSDLRLELAAFCSEIESGNDAKPPTS